MPKTISLETLAASSLYKGVALNLKQRANLLQALTSAGTWNETRMRTVDLITVRDVGGLHPVDAIGIRY
ncbi:unnamed protein product [Lupinus luteus]|uniref:Uncharacterized protein n=1 Tax=Lupinus luteus TaxID=3873 RepID=A0AAV1XI16_LUPLU